MKKIMIMLSSLACTPLLADQPAQKNAPEWITIWIPGTHPDVFIVPKVLKTMRVKQYTNFFYCPSWVRAADFESTYHHHQIARYLADADPQNFPFEHIYLGGWSGKLCFATRKETARTMYEHIYALTQEYQNTYNTVPRIRVITHSHGGNVALNMASWFDAEKPLTIDELIVLACPVQKETAGYIEHDMFKKVYSLHSHLDFIQVLDPQGWQEIKPLLQIFFKDVSLTNAKEIIKTFDQNIFSERHFKPHPKLKQAHIKTSHRGLLHVEFKINPFVSKLPTIIKQLDANDSNDAEILMQLNQLP